MELKVINMRLLLTYLMLFSLLGACLQIVSGPGSADDAEAVIVLRPVADTAIISWTASIPLTDLYEKIDETTPDNDTTYVYSTTTSAALARWELSPATISNGTEYNIRVWVIARKTGALATTRMDMGIAYIDPYFNAFTYSDSLPLTTSWANYTFDVPLNPSTGQTWTAWALNNTYVDVGAYYASPTSSVRVTQVGVIVYDVGEGAEPPGPESPPFEMDISIIGILGMVGFVGMIALPAAGIWMLRREGGSRIGAAVTILASFMFCFALFLASLG